MYLWFHYDILPLFKSNSNNFINSKYCFKLVPCFKNSKNIFDYILSIPKKYAQYLKEK